jgi:hypothetical protein
MEELKIEEEDSLEMSDKSEIQVNCSQQEKINEVLPTEDSIFNMNSSEISEHYKD